ncbi:MAG: hypothetical protein JWN85_4476 [Gammaproteobacteria bacterium]|nr:hypothetical protein [Gammaproteobacteria bacterium]
MTGLLWRSLLRSLSGDQTARRGNRPQAALFARVPRCSQRFASSAAPIEKGTFWGRRKSNCAQSNARAHGPGWPSRPPVRRTRRTHGGLRKNFLRCHAESQGFAMHGKTRSALRAEPLFLSTPENALFARVCQP